MIIFVEYDYKDVSIWYEYIWKWGFMVKRNNHIIRVLMDINHNIKYMILLIVVYKIRLFIFIV